MAQKQRGNIRRVEGMENVMHLYVDKYLLDRGLVTHGEYHGDTIDILMALEM